MKSENMFATSLLHFQSCRNQQNIYKKKL